MKNLIIQSTSAESNQKIYDFLVAHSIGVLATVDPDNKPHAAVVYFSVDKDFYIYFTTKRDTKKHGNLTHNNHAMVVAYEASSQTTVQIEGIAEDITGTPEAVQVYDDTERAAAENSVTQESPISRLDAGSNVAYRIRPVQVRMAVFIRPDPGGYDTYETIDFELKS